MIFIEFDSIYGILKLRKRREIMQLKKIQED